MSSLTSAPSRFQPIAPESAPTDVRATLDKAKSKYGFVPNLISALANSPVLLNTYLGIDAQFNSTSFTPTERQIILLTVSTENACDYCSAAHSTVAKGMLKVDADIVAAIRNGTELANDKLNALVRVVRELVNQRGRVSEASIEAFIAAGYSEAQLAEALVGVAQKTISNYFDHLSPVAIDAAFQAEARN
ncbi:MAG: carboxymuconolactone decarboxylase family protein [Synoicihabitans sp.]